MADLRLSAEARRDLREIKDASVEAFGPDHASRYMIGFGRLFGLLRDQPFAGQERPEFALDLRSISHRPYRLLYTVTGDTVVIVRVIHQARDVRRALQEEQ